MVRDLRFKAQQGHQHTLGALRAPSVCLCPGSSLHRRSQASRHDLYGTHKRQWAHRQCSVKRLPGPSLPRRDAIRRDCGGRTRQPRGRLVHRLLWTRVPTPIGTSTRGRQAAQVTSTIHPTLTLCVFRTTAPVSVICKPSLGPTATSWAVL
jgi:hypothetical protein